MDDYGNIQVGRTQEGCLLIVVQSYCDSGVWRDLNDAGLFTLNRINDGYGRSVYPNRFIKAAVEYANTHKTELSTEIMPALFRGTHCELYKCEGWEQYDFKVKDGFICMVDKRLGTAEEWYGYYNLYSSDSVWRVIDPDKAIEVSDIHAKGAEQALEAYLELGALASLDRKVQKILGKEGLND